MSSSRDNPLARFSAFIWGIGSFLIFTVLLLIFWANRDETSTLEDAAASKRYENKTKVDASQGAGLAYKEIEPGKKVQVPPHDVFELVGKQLAEAKPVAVEKPEQVVPGSPTAKKLEGAPKVDVSTIDQAPAVEIPLDPAVMEAGKAAFLICSACHGQNGEGTVGPPLAGSEWVTGPPSNLILMQLRGLQGAITVKGKEYNVPGGMAPMAYQDDKTIAAVLTYVRNSFGNKAPVVTPEQVAALRGEVGKPQVTAAELKKP
jgi:mono/diheme cytochrome c family protein